jgi:hypothetical protein
MDVIWFCLGRGFTGAYIPLQEVLLNVKEINAKVRINIQDYNRTIKHKHRNIISSEAKSVKQEIWGSHECEYRVYGPVECKV